MTVKDLIKELKKHDGRMPVVFAESKPEETYYEQVMNLQRRKIIFQEDSLRFEAIWARGRDINDPEWVCSPEREKDAIECILLTNSIRK